MVISERWCLSPPGVKRLSENLLSKSPPALCNNPYKSPSTLQLPYVSYQNKSNQRYEKGAFDEAAEAWVEQQITPVHTGLMLLLTQLASTGVMVVLTALVAAVLVLRRSDYWLGRLGLSVPGCILLNEVLKYLFHRSRPALAHPLVKLESYSFPSGHAVSATVFYGFLAILLCSSVPSKVRRVAIRVAAIALILAVGFSRVYLGVHYPTDVLGGMFEGAAWLNIAGMVTNRHRLT